MYKVNTERNTVNIRLEGVRLSFPNIFEAKAFEDGGTAKFSAAFIMQKGGDTNAKGETVDNIAVVKKAIKEVIRMGHDGKSLPEDKVCLQDGVKKEEYDGYGDSVMYLSASNAKRVGVFDRDKTPLTAEDGKPYAGCYVNATVQIWPQKNKYGKRVNAQLRAIQFVRDGEAFGESAPDPDEEFEDIEGGEDSDSWLD